MSQGSQGWPLSSLMSLCDIFRDNCFTHKLVLCVGVGSPSCQEELSGCGHQTVSVCRDSVGWGSSRETSEKQKLATPEGWAHFHNLYLFPLELSGNALTSRFACCSSELTQATIQPCCVTHCASPFYPTIRPG